MAMGSVIPMTIPMGSVIPMTIPMGSVIPMTTTAVPFCYTVHTTNKRGQIVGI